MRHQSRIALILALLVIGAVAPVSAATPARCFAETGYCVTGAFRAFWEANGGLPVFAFPMGPMQSETNRDTGKSYITQWFERNRFELHPENTPQYRVLLGRLGAEQVEADMMAPATPEAGCLWFDQTQHNVCDQSPGSGF